MAVYVDPIRNCIPDQPANRHCSLYADTPDELFNMAARLKLDAKYLQAGPPLDYYLILIGKRKSALRLGAIEHTSREKRAWLYARNRP